MAIDYMKLWRVEVEVQWSDRNPTRHLHSTQADTMEQALAHVLPEVARDYSGQSWQPVRVVRADLWDGSTD